MSKAKEIEILRECVERLGRDSYCGPWLKDQIPFIEHDMRCDIFPTPTWTESRMRHDNHLALANDAAERLVKSAKEEAERIKKEAAEYAKKLRIAALNAVERAIREIEAK